jgi:hypothetical protein
MSTRDIQAIALIISSVIIGYKTGDIAIGIAVFLGLWSTWMPVSE